MLYDRIGYIWQLSQLDELGLYRDNAVLAQLSFTIEFDAARAEYIDTGYWVELSTGAVYKKENLRPLKAVKHIKQDDTVLPANPTPVSLSGRIEPARALGIVYFAAAYAGRLRSHPRGSPDQSGRRGQGGQKPD